jgi:hypothetical protein
MGDSHVNRPGLESRLRALEDRQAICDVIHRYCRSLDRLDRSLLSTAFFDDARLDYGPGIYRGTTAAFIPFALEFQGAMSHTQHKVTNLLIELHGDRAFCESYVSALHQHERNGTERDLIVDARFLDGFERRDNEWRIAMRVEVIEFAHERESTRGWFENGPVLNRGRHDMKDPLYQLRADWLREI